jgi:hypothetical protein
MPLSVGGQPVVTVQQPAWRSVINGLITLAFVGLFGFGLSTFYDWTYVVVLILVVALPIALGLLFRPKFEFFDTYFQRITRRNSQQIEYSELETVEKYGNNVRITLKSRDQVRFGPRGLLIPGDPKIADGTLLSDWLRAKVPKVSSASPQDDSTVDASGVRPF